MAVLKKFRPKWWPNSRQVPYETGPANIALVPPINARYDLRPLTVAQIDECWQLDQRCFVDGEAYSRDTFEYLLSAPESVSYRVVTQNSAMAGFVIGLLEPDHTGHITTIGIAPEHRRRRLASCLMERAEDGFRRRNVRIVRLEVRAGNVPAQELYASLGYSVTQRLRKYYSNGGDGLLLVKPI
ncbi:MAG TPA: GNAT family N-acetyltransferase [Pyrinomonadaceae bacterium]|nr:GNAT family N-acetyltransferase [Pyrinomonadaceae bacterium]